MNNKFRVFGVTFVQFESMTIQIGWISHSTGSLFMKHGAVRVLSS